MKTQRKDLICENDKKNRLGWFLELPAVIILSFILLQMIIGNVVVLIVLTSINLIYLINHLVYYTIVYVKFTNELGGYEKQEPQTIKQKEHYWKCSYCGYETPEQFSKCSHCGAVK